MGILVKIHESYRKIVAISDSNLLGKHIIDGKLQLDLRESFYGGIEVNEEKAIDIIKSNAYDDAIFNIVGKESVDAALKAGIIDKKGIIKIKGIPHAMTLI